MFDKDAFGIRSLHVFSAPSVTAGYAFVVGGRIAVTRPELATLVILPDLEQVTKSQ